MPRARRRGRSRTAWMDNIKTWTVDRIPRGRVNKNDGGQGWMEKVRPWCGHWPTLGSRTAKEQNRTVKPHAACLKINVILGSEMARTLHLGSAPTVQLNRHSTGYCRHSSFMWSYIPKMQNKQKFFLRFLFLSRLMLFNVFNCFFNVFYYTDVGTNATKIVVEWYLASFAMIFKRDWLYTIVKL